MKRYIRLSWLILLGFLCASASGSLNTHDGPDPLAHWQMSREFLQQDTLQARLGPNGTFNMTPRVESDPLGESIYFNGRGVECLIAENFNSVSEYLPDEQFTVTAWVAVDQPQAWGGLISVMQDNGDAEQGWCIGYNENAQFTFALATTGADDGDGKMTLLSGKTKFEPGRLYHLAAVYDGQQMQLFVNGKLDGSSDEQSGPILYPDSAPFVIGSFHDKNEFYPLQGRIREVAIYDIAAKAKWVGEEFTHSQNVAKLPRRIRDDAKRFVVKPYLQYGTETAMTVMWRAARAAKGKLHWGETFRCRKTIEATNEAEIQEIRIESLEPETQYFYWVESVDSEGNTIESEVSTFQTASRPETPFAFAVIGDTQHNPAVSGPIAELAWSQRPNFLLHAGDLVDQGRMSDDWIDEFFASMHPLISRVPMYPVLGNHEQNSKNYFDYMSLPEPEYYYEFRYGNAHFFMIDSNRKVDPESEQYKWLDKALGDSDAVWKFVCHHHPPYSSDENDYGDLWKTNKSSRGDLRIRQLVPLYEKHHVDIVWTGHIHSYERTWPLREGKAVELNGTIYMITGGGGGGLETPGPYRPFFQNNVRRGHHYVMVAINGRTLEMKAFSLENQMIDTVAISKN